MKISFSIYLIHSILDCLAEFALLEEELLTLSENLEKAGIPIETLQTEFGAGQIEIVMKPVLIYFIISFRNFLKYKANRANLSHVL